MARTAAEIQTDLDAWYTIRARIRDANALQSYTHGERSYRLADLGEINKTIRELEDELSEASGSSSVILADLRGHGL